MPGFDKDKEIIHEPPLDDLPPMFQPQHSPLKQFGVKRTKKKAGRSSLLERGYS